MGSSYLISPLLLIINTIFDLYILLVLLRFLLQALRADFHNPISQFIIKLTAMPLRFLRKFIPSIGGQDTAAIVFCMLLVYAKFLLMITLDVPAVPIAGELALLAKASYLGIFFYTLADIVALTLTIFLVAVIIQVILSWVSPGQHNPMIALVEKIASPVINPVKKVIPSIGGLDLSPLIATLVLMVLKMLLVPPIMILGRIL